MDEFFDDPTYLPPEKKVVEEEVKEEEETETRTMFQIMSTVVNKSFWPTEDEIKKINSFMLVRYISNDPFGCQIGSAIDHFHTMPVSAQYRFVRHSLSNKISYIKFPKKEKVDNKEEIDILMKHYRINERTAVEYSDILSAEAKQAIIDKYLEIGVKGKIEKKRK